MLALSPTVAESPVNRVDFATMKSQRQPVAVAALWVPIVEIKALVHPENSRRTREMTT